MVNSFLRMVPGPVNVERIFLSTNGARLIGYQHTKVWSWTLTSHHIQELTQNRSNTKLKAKIIKFLEGI